MGTAVIKTVVSKVDISATRVAEVTFRPFYEVGSGKSALEHDLRSVEKPQSGRAQRRRAASGSYLTAPVQAP